MAAQFPNEFYRYMTRGRQGPTPNDHVDEFETDSGRPMISKLPGTPEEAVTIPLSMPEAAKERFMQWYRVDLAYRATSFYMTQPNGSLELFRFLSPPVPVEAGPDRWRIVMLLAMEG